MLKIKRNPTKAEILREQYLKELNTMKEYTNGVRVNEALVGRVMSMREDISEDSPFQPRVQSSTTRPIDFGRDIAAWMSAVREEARKLVRKNQIVQQFKCIIE